jgi:hypothetical protein
MFQIIHSLVRPLFGTAPLDNLFPLLVIAIVALFRWLSRKGDQTKKETPQPRSPSRPSAPRHQESDEEQVRRFLEALGQPVSSTPPPKVSPRPLISERATKPQSARPLVAPLPPVTTVPPEVPSPPSLPVILPEESPSTAPLAPTPVLARTRTIRTPVLPRAQVETALPLSDPGLFPETAAKPPGYSEIMTLLKSQRGLRDAIILREVFGPPRSLQKSEVPGLA